MTAAEGVTPFMTAAQSGDVSTVKYLLDRGGDLMKADEKGRTVVHHAACTGFFSVTNPLRAYILICCCHVVIVVHSTRSLLVSFFIWLI